ncbi:MAG: threonine/serine exporter family protein [Fibrobacter sp.]|nr:threonine/serine exporter family protein [Fibrobacter sp.]
MIFLQIFLDGLFGALAGIGFGAVSSPSLRCFKYIAILAACGHALRFTLMNCTNIGISLGSLVGGLCIGFGALLVARKVHLPVTVMVIPALLPMVPGKYAYNTIYSLLMFMHNLNDVALRTTYMGEFFFNGVVTSIVIIALAIGATAPMFIFPNNSIIATRPPKKVRNQ